MKWLIVSDLHYGLRQFDWVCEVASDVRPGRHRGRPARPRGGVVPIEAQSVAVARRRSHGSARRGPARGVLRQPRPRQTGRHASEKPAGWLQTARADQVLVDGDTDAEVGDSLVSVCGWWDGPSDGTPWSGGSRRRPCPAAARWVWVYHAPPTGSPLTWDGRSGVRRRRPTRSGWSEFRAGPGPGRPHPPVAVHRRRRLGGPDRRHLGLQPGSSAGAVPAHIVWSSRPVRRPGTRSKGWSTASSELGI